MSELSGKKQQAMRKAIAYLHTGNAKRNLINQDVEILVYVVRDMIKDGKVTEALELLRYYKRVFRSEEIIDLLSTVAETDLRSKDALHR